MYKREYRTVGMMDMGNQSIYSLSCVKNIFDIDTKEEVAVSDTKFSDARREIGVRRALQRLMTMR